MIRRNSILNKIFFSILIVISLITIGTIGYILIEHFNFIDALYMTVITVGTVGFREVGELSLYGKIFTIILILISMGVLAYSFSLITSYFIEGEIGNLYRNYKTKSGVKKMKNQTII